MILSYAAVILIGISTQAARIIGKIPNKQMKPLSIENCSAFLNTSSTIFENLQKNTTKNQFDIKFLFA